MPLSLGAGDYAGTRDYGDTGIGTSSGVGAFPKGEGPYKLLDASGNLWEWTTKWVDNCENYAPDERLDGDVVRTLCGGS